MNLNRPEKQKSLKEAQNLSLEYIYIDGDHTPFTTSFYVSLPSFTNQTKNQHHFNVDVPQKKKTNKCVALHFVSVLFKILKFAVFLTEFSPVFLTDRLLYESNYHCY